MNPFPSINEQNRQHGFMDINTNNLSTKLSKNLNFSEQINIEENSIKLALNTLNMSKFKYYEMTINELKEYRHIDCNSMDIYAINILIYYKQNSKNLLFPEITSINTTNKQKNNKCGQDKFYAKIYPEID